MSRRAPERQTERNPDSQPEYTIIKRTHRAQSSASSYVPSPRKTGQSKRAAALEERLSRRELQREKQYDAKRRRQWVLALGVAVLFVGIAAAALHFITNPPASTANTACTTPGNSTFNRSALITLRQSVQSSLASTLGISTSTLQSDLSAGETLAQIAQAQNKQISDVNTAYLNAVQNELNTLVSAGQMTQTQADQISSQAQSAVNNSQYTLLQAPGAGGSGQFPGSGGSAPCNNGSGASNG